jgi:phosphatidylglycerol:prolipoprotein diacylglycerol transferase
MFPRLLEIGGFELPSYGLLVALGFAAGTWVTRRLARLQGLPVDRITDLAVYCLLAGLAGAKLLMYAFDWPYFAAHPDEMVSISTLRAAGVFQGGFLAAAGFAFWYLHRHRLPALVTAGLFTPGLALGHAIGRLGCFAAGCCFGSPANLPWAVTYSNPLADGAPLGVPVHPAQLYEAAGNLVLAGVLYRLGTRPENGRPLLGYYLAGYSVLRFLVEFTRKHLQEQPFGLPFSLTQWISLGTLLAGLGVIWYSRKVGFRRDS